VAVALTPLPALAGEATPPAKPDTGLTASAKRIAATEAFRTQPERARAQEGGWTNPDRGSSSFFKSPAGILTLIVVGTGTAFALYSTSHDRVKSPGRE
jgi:hypothetical protein